MMQLETMAMAMTLLLLAFKALSSSIVFMGLF
jgi:hypothetical protein